MNQTRLLSLSTFSFGLLLSVTAATAASAAETAYTAPSFFDANGAYFGPDCDATNYSGAYYTGDYTSPFKKYLGKTDAEIQAKIDQLWNHYFKGDDNSKVYYDQGNDAYIMDTGNNDVRSEGMSYGMMISVQTNHKQEFDKIWNWAKSRMWHKNDEWDGYFSWQIRLNGGQDNKPAPDGELYFMMSLLFAANRWGDAQYMNDAQYILDKMWNNWQYKLFNQNNYIVTFQPTPGNTEFSDPSYDLPAFLELFSRWASKDQDKWKRALSATRDHLYRSSHQTTGLFTDYNNFDGTPHSGFDSNNPSDTYMFDAIRCPMNFGMDYYLFGADTKRQEEMAKKILNFFEKDNYSHAHFTWDGNLVNNHYNDPYTLGQKGANAVAIYALQNDPSYEEIIKKNLKMAWDGQPLTGRDRYYDGLVHFLAMLHLTGNFKIWKPKPTVEKKTVEGDEYNGVTYDAPTKINAFEGCKLYEVEIKAQKAAVIDTPVVPVDTNTNAIVSAKAMNGVKVWSSANSIMIENVPAGTRISVADMNGRILRNARVTSANHEIPVDSRGAYLVMVGNKTFKIIK